MWALTRQESGPLAWWRPSTPPSQQPRRTCCHGGLTDECSEKMEALFGEESVWADLKRAL